MPLKGHKSGHMKLVYIGDDILMFFFNLNKYFFEYIYLAASSCHVLVEFDPVVLEIILEKKKHSLMYLSYDTMF